MPDRTVIVVEDDPFPRMLQVMLDPSATTERFAALADFVAHDLPDFTAWCQRVRENAGALYPADVRLVSSQDDMRALFHHEVKPRLAKRPQVGAYNQEI